MNKQENPDKNALKYIFLASRCVIFVRYNHNQVKWKVTAMFISKKWGSCMLFLAAWLIASTSLAGNFEKGMAFYDKNQFRQAFPLVEKEARRGNGQAQFQLGKMYQRGEGTEKNSEKAFYWYTQGAEKNNADAQNNLANLYADGVGTPKNLKKAYELYSRAAAQGLLFAKFNLAMMYQNGEYVQQDYKKAFVLYKGVAEEGEAEAQYTLGLYYSYGKGTEQDYTKALEWYHKAADQSYPKALHAIGVAYQFGKGVPIDQGEAAKWYEKAAEQNYLPSIQNLGALYMADGDGLSQDWDKTYYWSKKGLELGDKGVSALRLGIISFSGHGSHPVDNPQAAYYFNLAGENGRADAWYWLGTMQEYGFGVKPDMDKAMAYYQRSADEGFKPAEKRLEQKDPSWTVRFFWWARQLLGAD